MRSISNEVTAIDQRISQAAQRSGRQRDCVRLIAVSKAHDADAIRVAAACGLDEFGGNYLGESIAKMEQVRDLALQWHFIGAVQSNKTRDIARMFQWVQTVDRPKIA